MDHSLVLEFVEEPVKVVTSELPLEGLGDSFVTGLENQNLVLQVLEIGEVVGDEKLPLKDREVDFNLI